MTTLSVRFSYFWCILLSILYAVILAACGVSTLDSVTNDSASVIAPIKEPEINEPRVFFIEPLDGAKVSSPFKVVMDVEHLTLEPAGAINPDHGHLHIIVDGDCTPPGEIITKDETHLHYGDGQSETELALATGEHTLCLQAADGAHAALSGALTTQIISITVE